MEVKERRKKRDVWKLLHRIPQNISSNVESFFYGLGLNIARNPVKWISGSTIVVLLCLFGLFRFRQEKNPLKLWLPPESDFVGDTEWLMANFKRGQQVESVILTGNDVLEPRALVQLNEITKRVLALQTLTHPMITWTDVCFKVPILPSGLERTKRSGDDGFWDEEPEVRMNKSTFEPSVHLATDIYCKFYNELPKGCLLLSILDIWDFDSDLIRNQTKNDIINKINTVKISPTLGHPYNFTDLLGDISRDESGNIISAKAVKTLWIVNVNFTDVEMNESGNDAGTADWVTLEVLNWELEFLKELERTSKMLDMENNAGIEDNLHLKIWYQAGRSWADISSSTIFQDVAKIIFGVLLMSIYVQIILSRFNWVEWRFCLTSVGLLCVGGAFVIAIGLCSLFGVPYGPVHTSLPFMLMGLGVDDIFVMMASWEQVLSCESNRSRPLAERVAMMLSHAGAAISVTSFTDVVAFVIGASTILPSLQSFCIYAAVGVMTTFLLQVTFFVAFFALDMKRVEHKRNGIVPCIAHENYEPTIVDASNRISWRFIDRLYSKVLLTIPGKTIVIIITLGIASVGVLGSVHLEQWFDPEWFLPEGTYLSDYLVVKKEQFPKTGHPGFVLFGDIDYNEEFTRILTLTESLQNMTEIDHVKAWPKDFANFIDTFYDKDLTKLTLDRKDFSFYLSKFLFSRSGGEYQSNFRFDVDLKCGTNAPRILVSSIDFTFARFNGPDEWIPAMDNAKRIAAQAGIHGFVTVWSKVFASWVTDKVIAEEVTRNLILALICVMATTAVLIAEPQTCFWILLCVLMTLLDVCGFMYYWGLTIDIVSCIGLELAVGLSVDYAAHVAHAFLNTESPEGAKNPRTTRTLIAVRHIGAAVTYGAGSTLLAQSLMAFSDAYVFRAFFKIFFLVIIFGIWHGLVFLPVILSTIGPKSLHKIKNSEKNFKDEEVEIPLKNHSNDQ